MRPDMEQPKYLEQPSLDNSRVGFQAVLDYDAYKLGLLSKLEQLQNENSEAEIVWLEWQNITEIAEDTSRRLSTSEPGEMTVAFLEEELRALKARIEKSKTSSQQARAASLLRIQDLVKKLSELVEDRYQTVIDEKPLDQICEIDYSTWGGLQIRQLESALQTELDRQMVKAQPGKVVDYASELLIEWDEQGFSTLLGCLAADHRDADVFLALLTASLGREKPAPTIMSPDVYASLLNGAASFTGNNQPFDFIGQAMPTLVNGLLLEDEHSIAEFCVLGLAVHYSAAYSIPEGLLWQIATEWPVKGMPGWIKLWQSALLGETCPIYTDRKQNMMSEVLAQARAKADKDFTRDESPLHPLKQFTE